MASQEKMRYLLFNKIRDTTTGLIESVLLPDLGNVFDWS
jgi:hypothetical protein